MQDLRIWWLGWGASVFLVVSILAAALVLFDMRRRGRYRRGWMLGVVLPPAFLLPSFTFGVAFGTTLPPDAPGSLLGLIDFYFWVGAVAGLVAVLDAIGYFTIIGQRPVALIRPSGHDDAHRSHPNRTTGASHSADGARSHGADGRAGSSAAASSQGRAASGRGHHNGPKSGARGRTGKK